MLDKQVFSSHSSARGLIHSGTCAFIQQTLNGKSIWCQVWCWLQRWLRHISSLQEADRKSQHNGESMMTEEIGVNREGWANRIGFWRWWEMAGVLTVGLMSMCVCERESQREEGRESGGEREKDLKQSWTNPRDEQCQPQTTWCGWEITWEVKQSSRPQPREPRLLC